MIKEDAAASRMKIKMAVMFTDLKSNCATHMSRDTCPAGQGIIRNPAGGSRDAYGTFKADGEVAKGAKVLCGECAPGMFSDKVDRSACKVQKACGKGQGAVDHSNTKDNKCGGCPKGTSGYKIRVACKAWEVCKAGEGKMVKSTSRKDYKCIPCKPHYFSAQPGTGVCKKHTMCRSGLLPIGGTSIKDVKCVSYPEALAFKNAAEAKVKAQQKAAAAARKEEEEDAKREAEIEKKLEEGKSVAEVTEEISKPVELTKEEKDVHEAVAGEKESRRIFMATKVEYGAEKNTKEIENKWLEAADKAANKPRRSKESVQKKDYAARKAMQGKYMQAYRNLRAASNAVNAAKKVKDQKMLAAWRENLTNKVQMTPKSRQAVLDSHNRIRRTSIKSPRMIELEYDMNLEKVAQDFVEKNPKWRGHNSDCTAQYKDLVATTGHKRPEFMQIGEDADKTLSHRLSTSVVGYIGENWFSGAPAEAADAWCLWKWESTGTTPKCSEEQNYWASQGQKTPNGESTEGCKGVVGHYTAVMHYGTTHVGCGYNPSVGTICNYAGGRYMPREGKPCSACPAGYKTCDEGLCSRS